MSRNGTATLPPVSALAPYRCKWIQLAALIRPVRGAETRLRNTDVLGCATAYNWRKPQSAEPKSLLMFSLIQILVSRNFAGKRNELALFFSTYGPVLAAPSRFLPLNTSWLSLHQGKHFTHWRGKWGVSLATTNMLFVQTGTQPIWFFTAASISGVAPQNLHTNVISCADVSFI